MSYIVVARRWRPQVFEDIIGQQHVTRTLQNAIGNDRTAHAYLFVGPRGIGKTTTARVFAKALNCEKGPAKNPCNKCPNCTEITAGSSMDVIEIDGASNNSVDDVRELRDNIRLSPTRGQYKIYVIDEVHMLSVSAFNALLKTLEEPPPHAKFIFATTEPRKIPATILSRCQRFDFRTIAERDIVERLAAICTAEGFAFDEQALYSIARAAEGSMRDAESVLDQLLSFCEKEISQDDVHAVLGSIEWPVLYEISKAVADRDVSKQLETVAKLVADGKELTLFVKELADYFRHLLVVKVTGDGKLVPAPKDETDRLATLAAEFELTDLLAMVEGAAALSYQLKTALSVRTSVEVFLIRMAKLGAEVSLEKVLEKLAALGTVPETAGGVAAVPQTEAQEAAPATSRRQSRKPKQKPADAPGDATDIWPQLLKVMGKVKMTVHSFLAHARPVGIEDDTFVVEVGSNRGFFKDCLEKPSTRALIEKQLSQIAGREMRFECRLGGEEHIAPEPAPPEKKLEAEEKDRKLHEAASDSRVKAARDTFGGEIVAVHDR